MFGAGMRGTERFALDVQALDGLRYKAHTDPRGTLKEVAKQFESLFASMLLKRMRETSLADRDNALFDGPETRMYMQFLDEQMAQRMAGHLGLAQALERQLANMQSAAPGDGSPGPAVSIPPAASESGSSGVSDTAHFPSPAISASVPDRSETEAVDARRDFVDRVWSYAVKAQEDTGVPARFIVAHAALESGWGAREIRTADGSASHNLFGIKAGGSWRGEVAQTRTTEYAGDQAQSRIEPFRVYKNYGEAFGDYARLLKSRYLGEGTSPEDFEDFAWKLQNGGYATDPQYADKLIRVNNSGALKQALAG
jgi:peptidoglycan hydrolase FlgJ